MTEISLSGDPSRLGEKEWARIERLSAKVISSAAMPSAADLAQAKKFG
jgi:hypothetical protein